MPGARGAGSSGKREVLVGLGAQLGYVSPSCLRTALVLHKALAKQVPAHVLVLLGVEIVV
jgi:hypothetical protein